MIPPSTHPEDVQVTLVVPCRDCRGTGGRVGAADAVEGCITCGGTGRQLLDRLRPASG